MKHRLVLGLILGLIAVSAASPSALAAGKGHRPKLYQTKATVTVVPEGIVGHLSSPKGSCVVNRLVMIQIQIVGYPPLHPISEITMSDGRFLVSGLGLQPGMQGKVTVRVPKKPLGGGDCCAATSKATNFAF